MWISFDHFNNQIFKNETTMNKLHSQRSMIIPMAIGTWEFLVCRDRQALDFVENKQF